MNIGYYSLLSAALGVSQVIAFEINPTNVLRMCESLRLNDYFSTTTKTTYHDNNNDTMSFSHRTTPQIHIVRRGVSNIDHDKLSIRIPSNPGQASMVQLPPPTTHRHDDDVTKSMLPMKDNDFDPSTVQTIRLDTFAQQQGWLSSDNDTFTNQRELPNHN
jgi:tRNA G37 N-methylase Trm5